MSRRILVIDDEQGIRAALGQLLEYEGYEVHTVANATEGIAEYQKWRPHLVFLDVKMGGMDGMEALKKIRELDPNATVVMISGHATIRTAVEATQAGAYEILEKPLDTDRILVMLRNALSHMDLQEENARLKQSIDAPFEIVGKTPVMRALMEKIEKVASTPARVLITGENGTGKELVARALHRMSPRANKPFVEVNCAAIPGELIESELFGHMKGSFTGAISDRAGKFESANKGTLFLDEIGDMSLAAQAKVLRVLQDNVITRIGSSKPISVDVRVIAATNKNLESEIAAGKFREDLYYRLNVVPIHVSPIRERREDIPLLAQYFAATLSAREGIPPRTLTADALERLQSLDWPGNVRELRNTVERLLILAPEQQISARDIDRLAGQRALDDAGLATLTQCRTFEEFKDAAERAFLLNKLRENDWNVSETARAVEMPRSNLYKKIERYSLSREHS
ncbi:MAG TPA: sigma-54 dependent transcriptional regulator [Gemmatimonadaceae bacterium]|jgi:two-component system nitrogen regulation response regulator NtrX|nr:sigma-54 dependent transcriptional regulator [Gemmatimonadaceae bacterium]